MNRQQSSARKNRMGAVAICIAGAWFALNSITGLAIAQKTERAIPVRQRTIVLAEDEVKQLLLLMDTDKNGKISKQEFMSFMEAEFDRLDKDKSGELDVKELAQSRLRPSRPAIGK